MQQDEPFCVASLGLGNCTDKISSVFFHRTKETMECIVHMLYERVIRALLTGIFTQNNSHDIIYSTLFCITTMLLLLFHLKQAPATLTSFLPCPWRQLLSSFPLHFGHPTLPQFYRARLALTSIRRSTPLHRPRLLSIESAPSGCAAVGMY